MPLKLFDCARTGNGSPADLPASHWLAGTNIVYCCQDYHWSVVCRQDDVSIACSNAVSPILLSFARKGQHGAGYMGQQVSKLIYKLGALYASLLASLVSVLSHGPWGVLLSLGVLGMTGLFILSTTYQLGRTIAQKVEQVIWTTG